MILDLPKLAAVCLLVMAPPSLPAVAGEGAVRETPLVRAVERCRRSVVNIHTERMSAEEGQNRFFNSKPHKITGMGTGIIVDERGYIVTNHHVILDQDTITVSLHDGTLYQARPVSFDRSQDLAIIRIEPRSSLTVMEFGTSSDLMLAETVFAVGNAFGYEHTVTSGIISALHRDVEVDETQSYRNLIQTDASINPGNSGGPLLNLEGEVIGINVAIRAGAQRIGFAIPIDDARRIIARLLSVEKLNGRPHGLTTVDVKSPGEQKLIVDAVSVGSAAEMSGLRPGDIIRRVRDIFVADQTDLERALLDLPQGRVVDIVLVREGREQTVQFTVGVGQKAAEAVRSAATSVRNAVTSGNGTQAQVVSKPSAADEENETITASQRDALAKIGLQLTGLSEREQQTLQGSVYRGGMKVLFVRAGSVASRFGIQNGDLLLTLNGFETTGAKDLNYILAADRLRATRTMTFRIRRGSQNYLQGTMNLQGIRF